MMGDLLMLLATMTFNQTTGQVHLAIVINSLGQALKVERIITNVLIMAFNITCLFIFIEIMVTMFCLL